MKMFSRVAERNRVFFSELCVLFVWVSHVSAVPNIFPQRHPVEPSRLRAAAPELLQLLRGALRAVGPLSRSLATVPRRRGEGTVVDLSLCVFFLGGGFFYGTPPFGWVLKPQGPAQVGDLTTSSAREGTIHPFTEMNICCFPLLFFFRELISLLEICCCFCFFLGGLSKWQTCGPVVLFWFFPLVGDKRGQPKHPIPWVTKGFSTHR